MVEFVQGLRYGLMAVGWLLSFGVGVMVLCVIASLLTVLGDWLNGSEDGNEEGGDDNN